MSDCTEQSESNNSCSRALMDSGSRFGDLQDAWEADPIYAAVWDAAEKLDKKEKKSTGVKNKVSLANFVQAYMATLSTKFERTDELCLATVMNDIEGDGDGLANSRGEGIGADSLVVSKESFYKMQVFYGAAPQNIAKMRDVLERGKTWFHGNKTKEVAQRQLLNQKQDNIYLVRYSTTKGAFTIDYKKRGKICRFNNIENLPGGRIEVTIGRPGSGTEKKYTYSFLSSFILKNSHVFGEPFVDFNCRFQWLKIRLSTPDAYSTLRDFLTVSQSTILSGQASSNQNNNLNHSQQQQPSLSRGPTFESTSANESREAVSHSNNNMKGDKGKDKEKEKEKEKAKASKKKAKPAKSTNTNNNRKSSNSNKKENSEAPKKQKKKGGFLGLFCSKKSSA